MACGVTWVSRVSAFPGLLLVGLGACSSGGPPTRSELAEFRSYSIPAGLTPVGAIVNNDGQGLLWFRQPDSVVNFDTAGARTRALAGGPQSVPPFAGLTRNGHLALMLRDGSEIEMALDGHFEVVGHHRLPPGLVPESGVGFQRGWVVYGRLYGKPMIWTDSIEQAELYRVLATWVSDTVAGTVSLSSNTSELVAAEYLPPFRLHVFTASGGPARVASTPMPSLKKRAPIFREPQRLWRALGAIRVASGFVQTLSDLTGAARLIVVSDTGLRITSVQQIDYPMGLLSASPDGKWVFGVRWNGHFEGVLLRWRARPSA